VSTCRFVDKIYLFAEYHNRGCRSEVMDSFFKQKYVLMPGNRHFQEEIESLAANMDAFAMPKKTIPVMEAVR
jgi:hypothetical protein